MIFNFLKLSVLHYWKLLNQGLEPALEASEMFKPKAAGSYNIELCIINF